MASETLHQELGPMLCTFIAAQSLSCVQLFCDPVTTACQAPLSIEFPRQEYWSGFPFLPPRDLPDPGIEPMSPALAGSFFTTEPQGKPLPCTQAHSINGSLVRLSNDTVINACLSVCLQCGRPGFNPWVGKIPWRRKWQSTPVLLPGKSHGRRSLVGYSPWGCKESDTTERLHFHFH